MLCNLHSKLPLLTVDRYLQGHSSALSKSEYTCRDTALLCPRYLQGHGTAVSLPKTTIQAPIGRNLNSRLPTSIRRELGFFQSRQVQRLREPPSKRLRLVPHPQR